MGLNRSPSGFAASVLAYLLWGFVTIYWKHLTVFDPFELISHRVVWSSVLLIGVLAATRRLRVVATALRTPRLVAQIGLASVLLIVNWTSYVYAVVHDQVVQTALGYFIAPIGTMLVGVYAMKEHLRRGQWAALALAAGAVAVIAVDYGRVPVIAILIGASWSAYGYAKRQIPLGSIEGLSCETLVLLVPAALLMGFRQNTGAGAFEIGSTGQIVLVLLTGVVTTTPLVLFAYAAKRTAFTVLGPVGYLVPTINFVLGVAVYHEPLGAVRLVGFCMVWVALAIITVEALR